MKALSIREPWISGIVTGRKTIETRTWRTHYRGDLLLVGSKNPKGPHSGKAVCIVEIYDVQPMTEDHERAALCKVFPKAQSWFLRNLRLVKPFDVKGQLSLYNVQDELIELRGP